MKKISCHNIDTGIALVRQEEELKLEGIMVLKAKLTLQLCLFINERHRQTGKFPLSSAAEMAGRLCFRMSFLRSLSITRNAYLLNKESRWIPSPFKHKSFPHPLYQASKSYAQGDRNRYDLFNQGVPGSKEFRKAWARQLDEEDCLWTGSEDESSSEKKLSPLEKEIRKVKQRAKEHSDRINADDSDELWSVWSGSDEEKTLWTGSECDDDDDIPTEPYPNEKSDAYIDKLFEFEEPPKYRTISELLKAENEPEELSPGKKARKLAVENALKKLKKGPDGRYTNVWEVMSDIDILIGAFENIVSGPEYAELRQGGPKKLNMQFFKDIQARMRDPNYKFHPEMKLKPKNKLVSRKKWQKTQSRIRKARKR